MSSTKALRESADFVVFAILAYLIALLIVLVGCCFGAHFLPRQWHNFQARSDVQIARRDAVTSLCGWDGVWYAEISRTGYSYSSSEASRLVFFPAYPMLGRAVARTFRIQDEAALLIVSNGCLVISLIVGAFYLKARFPTSRRVRELSLLSMSLWPTSLFFRTAYSESLFLLLVIIILYAMHFNWNQWWIAAIVGVATAARPVGVAVIPAFVLYVWNTPRAGSLSHRILRLGLLVTLSCWGIASFVLYQFILFGDGFVFFRAQTRWTQLHHPFHVAVIDSLTLRPLWSVYWPPSPSFWKARGPANPLLNLQFVNPIAVMLALCLILIGRVQRWISYQEVLIASGLILVPYVLHSSNGLMFSQARYMAVVFPMYIVMGQLTSRVPRIVRLAIFACMGGMLATYSALFAAWYPIF